MTDLAAHVLALLGGAALIGLVFGALFLLGELPVAVR